MCLGLWIELYFVWDFVFPGKHVVKGLALRRECQICRVESWCLYKFVVAVAILLLLLHHHHHHLLLLLLVCLTWLKCAVKLFVSVFQKLLFMVLWRGWKCE